MTESYPPPLDYFDLARPALRTEFVFQVRLDLKERIRFDPSPPGGGRAFVPPAGGIVEGPRLQGRIIPYSGAEWAHSRADNVNEINAHYLLEASDGTPIYVYNRGYHYSLDPANPRPRFGETVPYYFHPVPIFDTPVGPHDWLTRTVIVGYAKRFPNPDHTIFQYFAVL